MQIRYRALVADTADVLFPAGIPQLPARVRLLLIAGVVVSALMLTLLVTKWVVYGVKLQLVTAQGWAFQAGGVFMALASVSLYLAQWSWRKESYRAHRDSMIVTTLAATAFLCLHSYGIWANGGTESIASLLTTIQVAYLAHFWIAFGLLVWALAASMQHSTAITGYVLRLRPGVEQRMRLLGVLWAGNVGLWLYLQLVL